MKEKMPNNQQQLTCARKWKIDMDNWKALWHIIKPSNHRVKATRFDLVLLELNTPKSGTARSNILRRIELSNKLTECVLVPSQAAKPPPNYRGQIKVSASLSNMRYKALLSKVLFLPICPTSVSLNLRIRGHPLSREPSALIDLKFDDHNQQGIAVEHGHDCIQDHLYEASVEIKKDPSQALELSELLLRKAWHLRKLTVLVPANIRRTIAPRINHMKKVAENCEIIFL